MRKEYTINAPLPLHYVLTSDDGLNYNIELSFEHELMTEQAHCNVSALIPAGSHKLDFTTTNTESAEYTALKIIEHLLGCIMNRLVRIVNAHGHNLSISTDGFLSLEQSLSQNKTQCSTDVSVRHDGSIICTNLGPNELTLTVKVPIEPCHEMTINEPVIIDIRIACNMPMNTEHSHILFACSAIKALKQQVYNTLLYVGEQLNELN